MVAIKMLEYLGNNDYDSIRRVALMFLVQFIITDKVHY